MSRRVLPPPPLMAPIPSNVRPPPDPEIVMLVAAKALVIWRNPYNPTPRTTTKRAMPRITSFGFISKCSLTLTDRNDLPLQIVAAVIAPMPDDGARRRGTAPVEGQALLIQQLKVAAAGGPDVPLQVRATVIAKLPHVVA